MPFAHSNSRELNPMLPIKKQVNALLKRAFISEPQNNLAETAQANEIYETLSTALTKIQSLLGEVITINSNFVNDAGVAQFPASRTEHTVSVFSNLLNLTKSLDRYLMKVPNLNMLPQAQYEDIKSDIINIKSYNEEIQAYDNTAGKQLGWFRTDKLFPQYLTIFNKIFVRLQGYIMNTENGGFAYQDPQPEEELPFFDAQQDDIDFANLFNNEEEIDFNAPHPQLEVPPVVQQAVALNQAQKLAELRAFANQHGVKGKTLKSIQNQLRGRHIDIPAHLR